MTVKVDDTEPNIFPTIEYLDARDAGLSAEVIFGVKIKGKITPITVELSYVSIGVRSGPQIGIQEGPPRFAFRTISVRPVGAGRGCGDGASAG
jgi:hypothetical protein